MTPRWKYRARSAVVVSNLVLSIACTHAAPRTTTEQPSGAPTAQGSATQSGAATGSGSATATGTSAASTPSVATASGQPAPPAPPAQPALGAPAPVAPAQVVSSVNIQDEPFHPRGRTPFTILQINDVYSTVPVDGVGGLARVATIKKQLTAAGRNPILMIGGDFLSSSVASTVFKGEQMIEALNATGLDVATLGNHEFDFGIDMLITRMKQAKWQWVIANLVDRRTNRLVGDAPPYVMRTVGNLKLGIIGLCIVGESMRTPSLRAQIELIDPLEAAAKYIPQMKQEGADVIVALTHLNFADDRALAERFPDIDVIAGGHEHYPITSVEGRTLISKAGSDARFVARIDVGTRAGNVERFFELIPVTAAIADDPPTAAVINSWESRLGREMDIAVGRTTVALDARDLRLRASETNIGNFVADAIRQQVSADVALVNSGGIRGNREYPAGTLTRRDLLQMHPFGNVVAKIEVTGRVLMQALNFGVSVVPNASGQFPQVSGMTFHVDTQAARDSRVRELRINGTPVDPDKTYTLALPDYVQHGGDGYTMFEGARELVNRESGVLIVTALEHAVSNQTISPRIEGRIVIDR